MELFSISPKMNLHPLLPLLQLKTSSYLSNDRQSTCVLQISSLALSKISLWEWFPLSSELWIYSSPAIITIGKYAGSRSDIWKTKTTKQKKTSWTFPVQSISFLYFSQEPNVSKKLSISICSTPILSSTHFSWVFTL